MAVQHLQVLVRTCALAIVIHALVIVKRAQAIVKLVESNY